MVFENIPVIKYEGAKSTNPLAFKFYDADRIVLPGVGAFGDAKAKLDATNLVPVLQEEAKKKPLLGICLGMQLLFDKSFEYGEYAEYGT